MADKLEKDLNTTIADAVRARVEAEVLQALSGDEVFAGFISAALQQPVVIKNRDTYREERMPFITKVLMDTIQEATKAAVQRLVRESLPELELEVRKALRRDLRQIAEALTAKLGAAVENAYGFKVDVTMNVGQS